METLKDSVNGFPVGVLTDSVSGMPMEALTDQVNGKPMEVPRNITHVLAVIYLRGSLGQITEGSFWTGQRVSGTLMAVVPGWTGTSLACR